MTLNDSTAPSRHYTVAISKGAAVLPEMRSLLLHWEPDENADAFLERVQAADLLGKHTHQRVSDLVKRVFRPRLLVDDGRPARWLKYLLTRENNSDVFREMMLVLTARAEDVLYDFVAEIFWGLVRQGDLYITRDDVLNFLNEAADKRYIATPWSRNVQIRMGRSLLATLEEFGLVRVGRHKRREMVNYRLTDAGLTYFIHELHFHGKSDAEVVGHHDWRLFGLDRIHVLERLDALGPTSGLLVQRAGSVLRITWSFETMEACIDAISR